MNEKKYTVFETFVGAGGSHIGFMNQGFKSIFVNDIDEDCIDTLLLNNPDLKETSYIDLRSIINIDSKKLLTELNLEKGELDVMFGGIVCKGFSLAGDRSPNDERNYFYHKQLDLVKHFKPKISVIENVKPFSNGQVLSSDTPCEIKDAIDETWLRLAQFKGQKAEYRKKGLLTKEFENYGNEVKKEKDLILKEIKEKGYLISVLDDLYRIYDSIGYNVQHKILNAAWYGAATKRERIIIVATRKDLPNSFKYPIPKYNSEEIMTKCDFFDLKSADLKKAKTLRNVFSLIDYTDKEDLDNQPMNHKPKTVERFKYIPQGCNVTEVMDKLPTELKISSFYSRGNTMRLHLDRVAPTLVPGHSNFPIHPIEHRSITVREAAVITGFPLAYKFIGNHTKRCEHVGNAVPPPLAEAIAKSCKEYLDSI